MKDFGFGNAAPVYIEVGHSVLVASREARQVEVMVDRGADGTITAGARDKVIAAMKTLLGKNVLAGRVKAFVAIPAAGVIVRELRLPIVAKEQMEQVLRLQIEAEFPLSPDELSYGWSPLGGAVEGKQAVMVAAIKKETLTNYIALFAECGLDPAFLPAALARNQAATDGSGKHALLDVDVHRLELALFDGAMPVGLRQLPPKITSQFAGTDGTVAGVAWTARKLYVSGSSADMVAHCVKQLGQTFECAPMTAGAEASVAILGMKMAIGRNAAEELPWMKSRAAAVTATKLSAFDHRNPEVRYWLKRAAVLLALVILLPYLEALIFKPLIARKLEHLKADQSRLALIDNELDFLRTLKQSAPPYLDAVYVMAKAAPPGTSLDSLTMNARGEVTLHSVFANSGQVTEFRTKLIASGFFSNVTVEEQTAAQGRPQLSVRMSAQWKPLAERAALAIGPTTAEIQRAKTNHTDNGAMGGMPPMMMGGGGGMGMPAMGMPGSTVRIRR